MINTPIMLCVYLYHDFRAFVRDSLEFVKKQNPAFSLRAMAKKAQISPATLTLVLSEQRRLSPTSIHKLSKGLGLCGDESNFFYSLVLFNQAQETQEKDFHFQQMAKSKRYQDLKKLDTQQHEYCSKWYYCAIRELIGFKHFKEDAKWIAQQLWPEISAKQAQDALDLMLSLKLIKRDAQGKLTQADPVVTTGSLVHSLAMKLYHRQMLEKAARAIDEVPREQRDLSALTLSIPKAKLALLKSEIAIFRKHLISQLLEDSSNSDQVYQLNIQLFPLSKLQGEA